MALKLTFVVVLALLSRSGPLAFVLPDTTEFTTVTDPATVLTRPMPPPPVFAAVPLAVFPVIVLFSTRIDAALVVKPMPPPDVAAVFPVIVLFCTSRVPVEEAKPVSCAPPPAPADVLLTIGLLRMTSVLGVNPAGGAGAAVPKKWLPPPP